MNSFQKYLHKQNAMSKVIVERIWEKKKSDVEKVKAKAKYKRAHLKNPTTIKINQTKTPSLC